MRAVHIGISVDENFRLDNGDLLASTDVSLLSPTCSPSFVRSSLGLPLVSAFAFRLISSFIYISLFLSDPWINLAHWPFVLFCISKTHTFHPSVVDPLPLSLIRTYFSFCLSVFLSMSLIITLVVWNTRIEGPSILVYCIADKSCEWKVHNLDTQHYLQLLSSSLHLSVGRSKEH